LHSPEHDAKHKPSLDEIQDSIHDNGYDGADDICSILDISKDDEQSR